MLPVLAVCAQEMNAVSYEWYKICCACPHIWSWSLRIASLDNSLHTPTLLKWMICISDVWVSYFLQFTVDWWGKQHSKHCIIQPAFIWTFSLCGCLLPFFFFFAISDFWLHHNFSSILHIYHFMAKSFGQIVFTRLPMDSVLFKIQNMCLLVFLQQNCPKSNQVFFL